MPTRRLAALLAAAATTAATLAGPVLAGARTPPLRLHASFSPERLGHGAAVTVAFTLGYPPHAAALPVTDVRLLYPAGLGIGTSDLGLESCDPAALAAWGESACPRDSLMGSGSARVRVPFGPRQVGESAPIAIFSQPVREGHAGLLFAVSGAFPVIANLTFGAFLLPAGPPFGGTIDTPLPLVPSVPGGADVGLVALRTTIGGHGILYSERVGARTVRFHPKGVLLPPRCPRGGFPFAARLTFADGTHAAAGTAVACPRRRL
jgi:hypothetical protein